jgi:hypothetical protein
VTDIQLPQTETQNMGEFLRFLAKSKIIQLEGISNRMVSYMNPKFRCYVYVGNYINQEDKKGRSKKEPNCNDSNVKTTDLCFKEDGSADTIIKLKLR